MTQHRLQDAALDGMPASPGVPSRASVHHNQSSQNQTQRDKHEAPPSARLTGEHTARTDTLAALQKSIALYLHIPFCTAKCPYCDFNSYAGMIGLREAYVAALIEEIALSGARVRHTDGSLRRCRTVNFGGGTPSLLTAEQVADILDAVRTAFVLDVDAEISLEANPGALEYGRLDAMRAVGVNRLSMGAQSFDADLLRWLGRVHGPADIETAFWDGRTAGFTNINLDFMYALPGQSLATWSQTLDRALALQPDHLSLYSLIVEEGTPLSRWVEQGRVRPADEDIAADMYELAQERLAGAGYTHYEISNWARPGHECIHNLTYWQNLPYLGLGAGAHSWYDGHRCAEVRPPREYIARVRAACLEAGRPLPALLASLPGTRSSTRSRTLPNSARTTSTSPSPASTLTAAAASLPPRALGEDESIDTALERSETAILALRLAHGLDLALFQARFGCSFDEAFGDALADVSAAGLVEWAPGAVSVEGSGATRGKADEDGVSKRGEIERGETEEVKQLGWLRLTPRGRLLGNEVFARLLPTDTDGVGEQ